MSLDGVLAGDPYSWDGDPYLFDDEIDAELLDVAVEAGEVDGRLVEAASHPVPSDEEIDAELELLDELDADSAEEEREVLDAEAERVEEVHEALLEENTQGSLEEGEELEDVSPCTEDGCQDDEVADDLWAEDAVAMDHSLDCSHDNDDKNVEVFGLSGDENDPQLPFVDPEEDGNGTKTPDWLRVNPDEILATNVEHVQWCAELLEKLEKEGEVNDRDIIENACPRLFKYLIGHPQAYVTGRRKKGSNKRYFGGEEKSEDVMADKVVTGCWACGKLDHESQDCAFKRCFVCAEQGHESRECTRRNQWCQMCRSSGHLPESCPRTDYNKGIESIDDVAYCRCVVCWSEGHLNCSEVGLTCEEPPWKKRYAQQQQPQQQEQGRQSQPWWQQHHQPSWQAQRNNTWPGANLDHQPRPQQTWVPRPVAWMNRRDNHPQAMDHCTERDQTDLPGPNSDDVDDNGLYEPNETTPRRGVMKPVNRNFTPAPRLPSWRQVTTVDDTFDTRQSEEEDCDDAETVGYRGVDDDDEVQESLNSQQQLGWGAGVSKGSGKGNGYSASLGASALIRPIRPIVINQWTSGPHSGWQHGARDVSSGGYWKQRGGRKYHR